MNQRITVDPWDEWNQKLVKHAHPPAWKNPIPAGRYHLVVIGAGTAGLVAAAGAAGLGAKVALIERHLMGGDCLNTGCVPSKALLRAARAAAEVRNSPALGIHAREVEIDFAQVMERMRRLRSDISRHDSAQRFAALGVDVFLGEARFASPNSIEVEGQRLTFKRALIATGGRAAVPGIPGLAECGCLTNETLFSLTARPSRLLVLGGGPIGCEMAQAFQRLGSRVTLVEQGPSILPREDDDASDIVARAMRHDGVRIITNAAVAQVIAGPPRKAQVRGLGGEEWIEADEVLVAAGRLPNVAGLGLEAAGVVYDPARGVQVDDYLRTTNPAVYAAGDICMAHKFTHAADAAARIVIQNALFFGRKRLSALTIPWCTYTSPEIARAGLNEKTAKEAGTAIDTFRVPYDSVDRAVLDGEPAGLLELHTRRGTGRIAGATVVGPHAGESIGEIALALTQGIDLAKVSTVIHPYPTYSAALRQAADQYQRTRLTPAVANLLRTLLKWRR